MAQHGGKRPGAGAKPGTIKTLAKKIDSDSALRVLGAIDAESSWIKLAKSKDERVALDVLKYLTDRAFGKAKQTVENTGEGGGPIAVIVNL